jgi:hypothetical protein
VTGSCQTKGSPLRQVVQSLPTGVFQPVRQRAGIPGYTQKSSKANSLNYIHILNRSLW